MAIRFSFSFAGLALIGLGACGSLVTLDSVDPTSTSSPQSADGGVVSGTGMATAGGVNITPTKIDIANVRCGSQTPATITLTNPTDTDAQYQMSLSNTGSFQLGTTADAGTASGTVAAKSQATVSLIGLGNAPGNDSATILVNIGDQTTQINATVERLGAVLTVTPSTLDFGQVRMESGSQPTPVVFQNTGNTAFSISSFKGSGSNPDQFTAPTSVITIQPGDSQPAPFILNAVVAPAGPDAQPQTATFVPQSSDAYCGTSVPSVTLSGQRIDTSVTVTPTTLDFGNAGCGQAPAQATIAIDNYANKVVPYTMTLTTPGTKFTFVSNGQTSITNGMAAAGNGSNTPTATTIALQATAMNNTLGLYNEQLTVTTGTTGDAIAPLTTTTVTLAVHVMGAVLTVSEDAPLFFGFHPAPALNGMESGDTGAGTVTNTGNATACMSFQVDNDAFQLLTGSTGLSANKTADIEVYDDSCNDISGTLTIVHANCNGETSWPFCATPPTLSLKGSAHCSSSSGGR